MNVIYTVSYRVGGTPGDGETFAFASKADAVAKFNWWVERVLGYIPSKEYDYSGEDPGWEKVVKSLTEDGFSDDEIEDLNHLYYVPESSVSYDWDGGEWGNVELNSHEIPVKDRVFCGWGVEDVEHKFKELKELGMWPDVEYTEELGVEVMDRIEKYFDAEYGVTWDTVEYNIEGVLETK